MMVTFFPTSFSPYLSPALVTIPKPSIPAINPGYVFQYFPSSMIRSEGLIVEAIILTWTWCLIGYGMLTSS
jgi:hypothetical protein